MIAELVAEQRAALRGLDQLVAQDLVTIWRAGNPADPRAMTDWLTRLTPELATMHGDTAALLGADFYDQVRAAAGVPGEFTATPAPSTPAARVEASTRWAVGPLWESEPRPSVALTRLSGAMRRHVRGPYLETIRQAAAADPAHPRMARTTGSMHPCSFCTMLVSRGAVYSANTSTFRPHDHCRCGVMPIFRASDVPEESQRLAEEWQEVTAGASSSKEAQRLWRQHTAAGGSAGGVGSGGRGGTGVGMPGDDDYFNEAEKAIAAYLRRTHDSRVVSLPESDIHKRKNPDALVDNIITEFKTLRPGANARRIRNRVREAKSQAPDIVIDARGSGLTSADAKAGISDALRYYRDKVDRIRIIGDGFEEVWP